MLVGHKGEVVYRKAFGSRALEPRREPMTLDTIFDLASLTKSIATAPSIMRMVQHGQVRLNDPVIRYLPEFGRNGKEEITVRQLLTHFSGLRDDIDLNPPWQGKQRALELAFEEKPVSPPGSQFRYSDTNYIVLGAIVERVSGMSLAQYAEAHFFRLLHMAHTAFLPPRAWLPQIAPTQYDEHGVMLHGVVHDPRARRTRDPVNDPGRPEIRGLVEEVSAVREGAGQGEKKVQRLRFRLGPIRLPGDARLVGDL